ncbi:hypothetical protein AB2B38_013235 [Balneola sp. MJW-20]|uniref:hypothetical protein n=1 Tax=Gracilimonas aurantiaca TaxID=3234185 RepID=UPI003466C498
MRQQIFKLIFQHDMRLDQLAKRNANKTKEEVEATLADFMKPDPVYSKFYLSGTDLRSETFGLDQLIHYPDIIKAIEGAFPDHRLYTDGGLQEEDLESVIRNLELGEVVIMSNKGGPETDIRGLHIDTNSNVGHLKSELKEALEEGLIVIYKEQAKDGFDLHIFSKKNIYTKMFYPLQELLPDAFRFFSINGKKFRSERHFYFETWTLDKPPHGFEEVFPESVL